MRWRILAVLFFARVGLGVQFQTMGSVGDGVGVAFGLDYAAIGLMIGLFTAPGLFLSLPAGMAGRFVSDRALAAAGLGGLALGGLISALAGDPTGIALGRIIAGTGALVSMLYFNKMVADWFDGREIATAMSILVMSWPFGIAMGQVGHTWLAEIFDWRMPFLVASGYCAVVGLALWAFYRAPNDLPAVATGRALRLLPREWSLVLCAGFAWGTFNAGYVVYLSFAPEMLEMQGIGTLAAATIISVGSWVMILSGAACGQIVDRIGRRDTVLGICMAAAVGALLLLHLPGAGLAASLLFGLLGVAPAGVIMALSGQAVAPERRAFGMGVFLTVYYALMSAAPPVAGWIYDLTGTPSGAIMFAAGLFVLVLPASLVFRTIKAMPLPAAGPEPT